MENHLVPSMLVLQTIKTVYEHSTDRKCFCLHAAGKFLVNRGRSTACPGSNTTTRFAHSNPICHSPMESLYANKGRLYRDHAGTTD